MSNLKYILLSLLLLMPDLCFGYEFTHFNTRNSELPNDCINRIIQDSRGYIWVATYKGIGRYDGEKFRDFYKNDFGLPSDYVFALFEDSDGDVWIGTDNGVSMYEYRTDKFIPLKQPSVEGGSIHNKVTFITQDKDGKIWMAVNEQGMFSYDKKLKELHEIPYSGMGLPGSRNFRKILLTDKGNVWIARYHSNLYIADKNFENIRPVDIGGYSNYFVDDEIEGLFNVDGNKIIVASIYNGLNEVDPDAKEVKNLLSLPPRTFLEEAFMDRHGVIWLSTTHGVWKYDLATGSSEYIECNPKDQYTLSNDDATCVCVDADDGLWVGTRSSGLNYSSPFQGNFEKQYMVDGEPMGNISVSGFAEDDKGKIWISTNEKGLLRYDPLSHVSNYVQSPGLPKRINAIFYDDGQLWISTLLGLYRYNVNTGNVKKYPLQKLKYGVNDQNPEVHTIFKSSKDLLLVGTTLGMFRYDRAHDKFNEIDSFDGVYTTDISEDPLSGDIWFSTFATGLFCWNPDSDSRPIQYCSSNGSGLITDKISSVFVDDQRRIWSIGYSSGLALFDKKTSKFQVIDSHNLKSLTSDVLLKALEDGKGNLWLASDKGLVLFNTKTNVAHLYSSRDGLLDSKLTAGAINSSVGDMYFGTENGFIRFNPGKTMLANGKVKVAIASMNIGDDPADFGMNIDLVKSMKLKPSQRSFRFAFSILGRYSPSSMTMQYTLEGYDKGWKDISSIEGASYFNVPSGNYIFKARIIDNDGGICDAHAPIRISVRPVFWESPLGIAVILLAIIALIFAIVAMLERLSKKRQEEEERIYKRKKDEEALNDKMNFFSSVIHELKTPLTLIQTPLSNIIRKSDSLDADARRDLNVMKNSTEYLTKLSNELLDYVKVEKKGYTLKCEPFDASARLQDIIYNYSDSFKNRGVAYSFSSESPRTIINADLAAFDKIVNNLLSNALKYAKATLDIHLTEDGNFLRLAFASDGEAIPDEYREKIFEPFVRYERKGSNDSSGVGIGLPLARNLSRMLGGDLCLSDDRDRNIFILTFPIFTEQEDFVSEDDEIQSQGKSSGRQTILIVDDNKDFRSYLSSKLATTYDTIEASDVDSALSILRKNDVDMVLTDISMPGKSGIDLCKEIRSDIEISHIPIVMISAAISNETKIQAMKDGADLYIEKPFDLEYLKTSIKNIFDRRALLRSSVAGLENSEDIDIFGLPKKDEIFLSEFNALIKENISDSNLNNEFLSQRLNMSQSTLVRKIRKLMNTSPNNYVKSMRLSVAAGMLKNPHGNNISDVCYSVGFSNLSYFTKCFKEQYGVSPTEYAKKSVSD